jgi:hypothetical protein
MLWKKPKSSLRSETGQYEHCEDFEEFYGPDAYLAEPYPTTPIGNKIMEVPLSPSVPSETDLRSSQERLKAKKKIKQQPLSAVQQETALKSL